MKSARIAIYLLLLTVYACQPGNSLSDISDDELTRELLLCREQGENMAPSRAIACGNYIRECKHRREDQTYFLSCE